MRDKLKLWILALAGMAGLKGEVLGKAHSMNDRGQLGLRTILAAFVVVIASFVVIIVVDEFDQSLGDPASSELNNSSDSILEGFSGMMGLIEPLLLIAIGVVIIGLIRRVR